MKATDLIAKHGNDSEAICRSLFDEFDAFLTKTPDNSLLIHVGSKIKELRFKWKAVASRINGDPNYFDAFIRKHGGDELLDIEKQFTPISKRY